MMAAVATLGLLMAQPAQAELSVRLGLPPQPMPVPAELTMTASVAGDDPVVEYAWEGPDGWPICRGPRCALVVPTAACRRVAVQVTGLSGATATATAAVCASDLGMNPPRAELDLQWLASGLRVAPGYTEGSVEVVSTQLFIDEDEVLEPFGFIEAKVGGCHAIDLVVVDADGRTGEDRRIACLDESSPRVQLAADPSGHTREPLQKICARVRHPLGLDTERVSGPILGGEECGAAVEPPLVRTRSVLRVRDPRGVESAASLSRLATPESEPWTVPWAVLPETIFAQPGGVAAFGIRGGELPLSTEGQLLSEQGERIFLDGVAQLGVRQSNFRLPTLLADSGPWRIRVTVRDRRGFGTVAEGRVEVRAPPPDAGTIVGDGGPGPVSPQSGAIGCTALGVVGTVHLGLLALFVGLADVVRRRRR